jgi:hypothetical protein
MRAELRRKLEMATRALNFSLAHPDGSAGYVTAVGRLTEGVARAEALATQQRAGIIASRAATARKRDLKSTVHHTLLDHVARVAEVASKEVPELARKFQLPRDNASYHAFRTAAGAMAAEAAAQQALLVRHGLSEPLLARLAAALEELDAAVDQATEGRRAHVGAGAELATVIEEAVQVVRVLDGLNRFRFASEVEQLAAWESATNVLGPVRREPGPEPGPGDTPPAADGSQVQPAA